MRKIKGTAAINEALIEEMRRDKRVYCLGEDIGLYHGKTGASGTSAGMLDEFGEERVVETPIAETAIIGTAVGAAMFGMRPVAEIMHSEFLATCAEHLVYGGAKGSLNSHGLPVPMVVRARFGGVNPNMPIQNENCEAMFCNTPGLKVVIPSNGYDAKGLLKSSIRDNYPVLFLEHNAMYSNLWEVPEEEYTLPLGKAEVKREGSDITIVAYGFVVNRALEAAEKLAGEGISVEVVDLRTIAPLDIETVLTSVKKTGRAIVLHEARKTGGYGGEIAAVIAENAFEELKAPIIRVTGADLPVNYPPTTDDILIAVNKAMKAGGYV